MKQREPYDFPDFDFSDDDATGAASGKKRKPKSAGRGGSPPKRNRGILNYYAFIALF